jgi:hypothetical protein
MKVLTILLVALSIIITLFLIWSFALWELNPAVWTDAARGLFAFMMFAVLYGSVAYYIIEKPKGGSQ